jgi:diguanylate cyclase (GGDEF)-like protein
MPVKALSTDDTAHPIVRAFLERAIQPIDPATAGTVFGDAEFVAGFAVPLQAGGESQGVLTPGLRQGAPVPVDGLVLPTGLLADAAAQALKSLKTIEILELNSERDALTGFYKRDAILKRLEIEIRRAERSGQPVSLANVKIEGVSEAVRKFGATVGDALLPKAATLLMRATRTVNVLGRDRDDRFFVLVFDANKAQTQRAAEAIQKNFSTFQDPKLTELGVKLNVTFGIASYPEDAFDVQSLAIRAEEALDDAIKTGPGSVVQYGTLSAPDSGLEF